ncbi:hypothetical protein HDA40_001887 [Hamadaea flava]|uniref:Excreted virulence factor EspC (Type VII ESX diderm) n=1 Tax=Hamadaea flava TaxID=1742688 RepID=A0ABV8LEU5_9ACTN|nr:hypothetical protein [Hamadaea flava]MCP2323380.1 hypothetical protein [Hamadaea flava]
MTDGFQVEPEALRQYAAQLSRAQHDTAACQAYSHDHLPKARIWDDGGLINKLFYEHNSVREEVNDVLTRLHQLLTDGSSTLAQVADHYAGTDTTAAARLDAAYPPVTRPSFREEH